MPEYVRVKIRRGTTAEWEAANPVLRDEELGADITLNRVKRGDVVRNWLSLDWCDDKLPEILASGFNIYPHSIHKEGEAE